MYKDREPRGRRGEFGDRRGNNREPRQERSFRDNRDSRNDRDTVPGGSDINEADFFDSLMSELSDDLEEDKSSSRNERQARGTRHHDNAGPNVRTAQTQKSDNADDSFFANLMSELGGSIGEAAGSSGGDSDLDDDDFFSNLEAELSQSLGGDDGKSASSDDDDFFASLQSEMENALEESPAKSSTKKSDPVDDDDDFFANLQSEMENALEESSEDSVDDVFGDDFFSGLIDEIADEVEASSREDTPSKQSSPSEQIDLSQLTVSDLKDMLRSKGLKVGGKKSELIERLQQS